MKIILSILLVLFVVGNSLADTFEAKYNTAQWLPVVVLDGSDGITPEVSVTGANVSLWYKKGFPKAWTQLIVQSGDGSGAGQDCVTDGSETPESGDWCEESSTNAPGSYRVYVPATVTDTKGKLFYVVKGTGYKTYWGQVSITANTAAEDPIAAILDDTGTSGVLISDGTGTGQVNLTSGAIDTVTSVTNAVTVGTINTDAITNTALAATAVKEIKDFAVKCDISASTSGTSFTIAACTDEDGTSITLDTDRFVGSYMVAYTNGGAQCNVVGHGVFVGDQTAGVVTVKDSDLQGSGFPAIPNITNCGVRISP